MSKAYYITLLIWIAITISFSIITEKLAMDLSKEIIDTLNNDHVRMKNFKENFRRMSCKLLVTSKLRALYETEELDKYTNQTTPESRPLYLDKLYENYYEACMKTYREDKLIFEKELFYSYPSDDEKYQRYLNVSLQDMLEGFPKYNVTEHEIPNKEKSGKTKKERKDRITQENENLNKDNEELTVTENKNKDDL